MWTRGAQCRNRRFAGFYFVPLRHLQYCGGPLRFQACTWLDCSRSARQRFRGHGGGVAKAAARCERVRVGAVVLGREENLVGGACGRAFVRRAVDGVERGHRVRRARLVQDRSGESAHVLAQVAKASRFRRHLAEALVRGERAAALEVRGGGDPPCRRPAPHEDRRRENVLPRSLHGTFMRKVETPDASSSALQVDDCCARSVEEPLEKQWA